MSKETNAMWKKRPEDGMVRFCFDRDSDRFYLVGVKHTLLPSIVAEAVMGFFRHEYSTLTPFHVIVATYGLLQAYQSISLLSLTTTRYNGQLHVSIYFTRSACSLEVAKSLTNSDSGSITLEFEQTWQPLEADDPFCFIGAESARAPKAVAREAAGIGAGRWVNPAEEANNVRRWLRDDPRVRVTAVEESVEESAGGADRLLVTVRFDWLSAPRAGKKTKGRTAR